MARVYQVTCNICSFEKTVITPIDSYFYEDATLPRPLMFVWQQIAWCSTCKTVVNAEYLPDPDELQVGYMRLYLKWRLSRQSSARCLHCGSMQITPSTIGPTLDQETLPHPGCSGVLSLRRIGHAISAGYGSYTAEGIRISSNAPAEDEE